MHKECRDLARRVEIERERAVEIGFGLGKLVRGRAILGQPVDFLFDEIQGFPGAVGTRGGAAEEQRGVVEPDQAVRDRICKTALLAHLLVEARRERAAAEDVIDDISGHEIWIFAGDTGTAERHHGLRHVELDDNAPPETLRRHGRDRRQFRLRGQRTENAVEHLLHRLGVDVADDRDFQIGARQRPVRVAFEIVDGDGRHRFQRACHRAPIGMIDERGLPPAEICDLGRAGRGAPQRGHDLRAVDLDVNRIEARRGKRQAQVFERLVAILGQRAQRAA